MQERRKGERDKGSKKIEGTENKERQNVIYLCNLTYFSNFLFYSVIPEIQDNANLSFLKRLKTQMPPHS